MTSKQKITTMLLLGVLLVPSVTAQQKLQEDVTVTAVEVPVRVLIKGRPVKDLGREHFKIFENGLEQEITQFQIVSRRIADQPESEAAEPAPRLFLLIFNIYDYEKAVGEAIDDFFRDVFRPSDSILVLTEDRILHVERGQSLEDFVSGIKDALINFKSISTQNTIKNFRELKSEGDRLLGILRQTSGAPMMITSHDHAIIQFYEKYRHIWEVYRSQFLLPDLYFYELLLRKIRSFEGEKWAICFQQREMFPMLKFNSQLDTAIENWLGAQVNPQDQVRARLIQSRRQDLRRRFDLSSSFAPDLLSDLFLGADMTFHLILLKSTQTLLAQNFELREVGQDFEEMLKRISAATGGHTDFSNRPVDVLKEAATKEDYHYLLVYSPPGDQADQDRKIQVRVDLDGVDVVYLKRPFRSGPELIGITNVQTAGQQLSFAIENGQMLLVDGLRRGSASVKIVLYNETTEKVFDEGRTLELTKGTTRISLNLANLGPGNYFLIIEVADLVSGARDIYNGNIQLERAPQK